jgi:hypothetical protein
MDDSHSMNCNAAKHMLSLSIAIACLAAAAPAVASTQPLAEGACLGGETWVGREEAGCTALAPSAGDLGQPVATLASPDERNLYVVEQTSPYFSGGGEYRTGVDAVVQLRTDAKAAPEFVSCTSQQATPDCAQIADPAALFAPQSAAIAPDGKDLYVASLSGIARFAIDASGAPRYVECVGLAGGACEDPPGSPGSLETVQITLAPDGHDLYSVTEGLLRDFHIESNGTLSLAGCYSDRNGCSSGVAFGYGQFGMASVSPDGETVVTALGGARINVYRRLADGALLFESCFGIGGGGGGACQPIGPAWPAFGGLQSIVFAPNGRDAYVQATGPAGMFQPAVFHLRLSSEGTLQLADCLGYVLSGCQTMPAQAPTFPQIERVAQRLAISPDGHRLILAGEEVVIFSLDPSSGEIAYEGCAGGPVLSCSSDKQETIAYPGGSVAMTPSGESFWLSDATNGIAARFDLADASVPSATKPPQAGAVTAHSRINRYLDLSATAQTYGATKLAFEVETAPGEVHSIVVLESRSQAESRQVEASLEVTPATSYRVRLAAVNQLGTSDGPWLGVKTPACQAEAPTRREFRGVDQTPTSIDAIGSINRNCGATTVTLRVGTTPAYGESFIAHNPILGGNSVSNYAVEASGLQPDTNYYWQLVAANSAGSTVIESGEVTTPEQAPASQLSVLTGADRSLGAGSFALEGLVRAGDTPVSVEALIFDSPYETVGEPFEVVPLDQVSVGNGATTVSTVASGLQCGHAYTWSLRASASYGESVGEREPLTFSCGSGGGEGGGGEGGGAGEEPGLGEGPVGGAEPTPEVGPTAPVGTADDGSDGSDGGSSGTPSSDSTVDMSSSLAPQSPISQGSGPSPQISVLADDAVVNTVRIARVDLRRLHSGGVRVLVHLAGQASGPVTLELVPAARGRAGRRGPAIARSRLTRVSSERDVTLDIGAAALQRARSRGQRRMLLSIIDGSHREVRTVELPGN